MHIVFGSDHAGYKMKQVLKDHLKSNYQEPYNLFIIDKSFYYLVYNILLYCFKLYIID